MTKEHSKWILGSFCRESASSIGHEINILLVAESRRNFKHPIQIINYYKKIKDKNVLFMHQGIFIRFALINNLPSRNKVFVTHTNRQDLDNLKLLHSKTDKLFVMNSNEKNKLINIGIPASKIKIVYGAVDKNKYKPSKFKDFQNYVAIVGNYGERKNPETIEKLINHYKDINFVIHGNGWDKIFRNVVPNNLQILKFDLNQNPTFLRDAFCYLTLSHLEGGPIPTLEALSSGTPVVASNTGFNSDFINKQNGTLLRDNQNLIEISQAIYSAKKLKSKNFKKDLLEKDLSYRSLGNALYSIDCLC